jgi:hypothetical protein
MSKSKHIGKKINRELEERARGYCERCNKPFRPRFPYRPHAHHLTYDRWGKERLEDLLYIHEGCHKIIETSEETAHRPGVSPEFIIRQNEHREKRGKRWAKTWEKRWRLERTP